MGGDRGSKQNRGWSHIFDPPPPKNMLLPTPTQGASLPWLRLTEMSKDFYFWLQAREGGPRGRESSVFLSISGQPEGVKAVTTLLDGVMDPRPARTLLCG